MAAAAVGQKQIQFKIRVIVHGASIFKSASVSYSSVLPADILHSIRGHPGSSCTSRQISVGLPDVHGGSSEAVEFAARSLCLRSVLCCKTRLSQLASISNVDWFSGFLISWISIRVQWDYESRRRLQLMRSSIDGLCILSDGAIEVTRID